MLNLLKKEVRSLLIASKGGLTPVELEKEYRSMIGEHLPFRALGYQSTMELVMDMPDVVDVCHCGNGSVVLNGGFKISQSNSERTGLGMSINSELILARGRF